MRTLGKRMTKAILSCATDCHFPMWHPCPIRLGRKERKWFSTVFTVPRTSWHTLCTALVSMATQSKSMAVQSRAQCILQWLVTGTEFSLGKLWHCIPLQCRGRPCGKHHMDAKVAYLQACSDRMLHAKPISTCKCTVFTENIRQNRSWAILYL